MDDNATHASDCGWQVGQYPWECTCGLIARLIIAMDELIAQDADLIEKIALKPCPFCGGAAKSCMNSSCDCCGSASGVVYCSICSAEIGHCETEAEAIARIADKLQAKENTNG